MQEKGVLSAYFLSLNYHLRKFVLSCLTFKELKRLLYLNKQMQTDIFSYFKTHLVKLTVNDTLPFENVGYSIFFKRFGQNLQQLSIFCIGLDFQSVFSCLPSDSIKSLKLIMCPYQWIQKRSFFLLIVQKCGVSLRSLQIQVYSHIINESQTASFAIQNDQNGQIPLIQSESQIQITTNSYSLKPVTMKFLNKFWSSFRQLTKISIKEVHTNSDFNKEYNTLLESIFTTPHIAIRVLKIQNMIFPNVLFLKNLRQQNNSLFRLVPNTPLQAENMSFNPLTDNSDNDDHLKLCYNVFQKLDQLKITSTRNSQQFLGINDNTLSSLMLVIPQSLTKLEILDYQSDTNQGLREKSFSENLFLEFLKYFPDLSVFIINCFKTRQYISNFALMHMTEAYSNLMHLGLASCNNINSGTLNLLISRNSTQLQELCMDYTQLEGALDLLVSLGVQLKKISINHCKRISKQEIINFCSHSNVLTHMSVKMVQCFTKKALVPLVQNNFKSLTSIVMEGNKIDNTHIAYLLRYCRKLSTLALRKMDKLHYNFTNQLFHVIELYAHQENYTFLHEKLTYLDISYNSSFNDGSISNISRLFPNIYTFLLDSCSVKQFKSLLSLSSSVNSLNVSGNPIVIRLEEQFLEFWQYLQQFCYLNTIFIEIPDLNKFLKNNSTGKNKWKSKPLIIKESFNMTCHPISRN